MRLVDHVMKCRNQFIPIGGKHGVDPPKDKKITVITNDNGYFHDVMFSDIGIEMFNSNCWMLADEFRKLTGRKKNLYCLWDEGHQAFVSKEHKVFTFEAEDFGHADVVGWDIIEKFINDGTLTNEGTMTVEIGEVYEIDIDNALCHRARTKQIEG